MRSWLFAPGDSAKKLAKAPSSGADVVIADLEDAVPLDAKDLARAQAAEWLADNETGPARWVRINALSTPFWRDDLTYIMQSRPAGILLPKASGPDELAILDAEISAWEQRIGIPSGHTQIMPLVSETPRAALTIPAYGTTAIDRLTGLTWGSEDLMTSVGASRKRDGSGQWTDLFRMIRAQLLLAAHATGGWAIDALYSDFRDPDGLARSAAEAAADGFTGMLAIHPAQVSVINEAFQPSAEKLAQARAIVAAFAANPGAAVLQLDGRMIETPHLKQAENLLQMAG
ncbi:CoA ester lyase [Altericroceibacterium spongiae]|uniref:CoA ester lyase n=1 Tax=Altericroceibacterium spongiae TaxID=2320269 RepID=A0A420EKA6_9SPHN|nr:CoA ester lyase [Altericroceibacterium spongiae]RKF21034.1 CoA ester lyase [Altericroceibacterium spongiae]